MDPLIYLELNTTAGKAILHMANEQIQAISARLSNTHTPKSRAELIQQIQVFCEIVNVVNRELARADSYF